MIIKYRDRGFNTDHMCWYSYDFPNKTLTVALVDGTRLTFRAQASSDVYMKLQELFK